MLNFLKQKMNKAVKIMNICKLIGGNQYLNMVFLVLARAFGCIVFEEENWLEASTLADGY